MIRVNVGTQGDLHTYELDPRTLVRLFPVRELNLIRHVAIEYEGPPETMADRWLLIVSMLTGRTLVAIEEEGFEVFAMGRVLGGEAIPIPSGTIMLREERFAG